jgi:hypothetical protein
VDLSTPQHAAIWAAALAAFFGCQRLGEIVVGDCNKFSPTYHITRGSLVNIKKILEGNYLASFQIPWTKTTKQEGALVVLTSCYDDLCPVVALLNHYKVNFGVPGSAPLFAFGLDSSTWNALERPDFLFILSSIWGAKQLEVISGHSFHIGSMVALLLAGVPRRL